MRGGGNRVMTVNTVIFTGFIFRSQQLKNIFADRKICTEQVLTRNISHMVIQKSYAFTVCIYKML